MRAWDLPAETIVALPLDELAMRLLLDVVENDEWNWRNWMLAARAGGYANYPDAMSALAEAWAWLRTRGLVVANGSQDYADGSVSISRQGHEALERGLPWVRAHQRLDVELVPELEAQARPQFLRGDFEAASFMAMKEVEVRVRALSALPSSLVGTTLMQQAFRLPKGDGGDGGPLYRTEDEPGESVAVMNLFAGAIGLFKNPASHRRVDFGDATEAAEVVLLADLLMRLLDKLG
jgi:uncharacterized protein (TIGR02391 family)